MKVFNRTTTSKKMVRRLTGAAERRQLAKTKESMIASAKKNRRGAIKKSYSQRATKLADRFTARAGKTISSKQKAIERIMQGATSNKRVSAGRGRPYGSYRYRSPITGKKVPVHIYKAHTKALKNRFKNVAEQTKLREQAVLARRGIPPQITRQIQEARIRQVTPQPQVQEVQSMPTQPIQQQEAMPHEIQREVREVPTGHHVMPDGSIMRNDVHRFAPPKYKIVTDIMTGRKMIKPLPPRERWLQ